jgi:putative membrane protein
MRRSLSTVAILAVSSALLLSPTRTAAQTSASAREDRARSSTTRSALDDATIVAIFDGANTADVETGRLAAERGHTKEVREYGAMIARDHETVRQQGRDLAHKLGVTPTPPANDASAKAHTQAMKKLRAKRGASFDRAFLRHEATFHKTVIEAIQTTLLPAIRNEDLKALVVKVAPAFQAHMLAAEHLEKKLSE